MVFTSFAEQKVDNRQQELPETLVLTRDKRFSSNNCYTCEHCRKTFECGEVLSTHLLHCPIKHNILSKTLASGNIETIAAKRIKLQAVTPEEAFNGKETHELDQEIMLLSDSVATDSQNAVNVKQEYGASESTTSGNLSVTAKKRKLKNRRVFISACNLQNLILTV